jgi:hypothetical protein
MSGDESKQLTGAGNPTPQSDGIDSVEEALKEACRIGEGYAARILSQFGALLGRKERVKVTSAFRRRLLPPRRRGRRRTKRITEALEDWMAGVRGVAFYRVHIPGWEKHNIYRRRAEEKALRDAIRSRERREQKRRASECGAVAEPNWPR